VISKEIILKAYKSDKKELIIENWVIDSEPIWHIEYKGLKFIDI